MSKRSYFSLCRSEDVALQKISVTVWLLPGVALAVGVLGMSAVWVAVAVLSERPCSWLALLAALDMAMLLRLTNAPVGGLRMLAAVLATGLSIAASHWLIVATHLGFELGLEPMASAARLGPALAWELSKLSLGRVDWILLVASLPLAAILTQGRKSAG